MDFSKAVDLDKKKSGISTVDEAEYGVYVWELPDGRWVGDGEGNWMTISGVKGDRIAMKKLEDAAKAHGVTEGAPAFLSGHRRVTDEEFEEQRQRLMLGLVPDTQDNYSQLDGIRHGRS